MDELPGPEAILALSQSHARLHAAVQALSANERWIVGLAYFRDLSHSEIAQFTDLPLGTVKSHLNRAQARLRASLAAPGNPNPKVTVTLRKTK
jgi:RNA polymerase sigma-70 factor, ECF subfamily